MELYLKSLKGRLMKIFISVFLVLIVGLSFYLPTLTTENEILINAGSAFALAKGLNMVVSVLQGTELSITPLGFGLNLSIGEMLDPFNDMIERFSIVMLASVISLGIQKLILELSSTLFLQYAFVVSVVFTLFYVWIPKLQKNHFFSLIIKTFLLVFLLRFGALFFMFLSSSFYITMQQSKYEVYAMDINTTKNKLDAINEESKTYKKPVETQVSKKDNEDASPWYNDIQEYLVESKDSFKKKFTQSQVEMDMSKKLEGIKSDIENTSNTIIEMMTIFIVQTILFPLLFLWLFISLIKLIFNIKINYDIITSYLK